jgi:phosphatidylglycerol:prolipoprotein diacylglycerol transferase
MKEDKSLLLSVTAMIFLAFVFGCKLIPQLEYLLFPEQSQYLIHMNSQMAFGGIALSLVVILILRKFLEIDGNYWFTIGLASIVGLIVQKPGCLLGGCCKGVEVPHNFGVMYFDGMVRHPLQFYEFILYVVILFLLIKLRTKRKDTKYFLVISAYCLLQFGLEFIRDSSDTIAFSFEMFALKAMQWNYLIMAVLTLFLAIKNETRVRKVASFNMFNNAFYHVLLITLVIIAFFMIHERLFSSEVLAINIAFMPAIYSIVRKVFISITVRQFRWASLCILTIPVLLMSQTMKETIGKKDGTYKTIRIGYHGGTYNNEVINATDPGSCSGSSYATEFTQKYTTITVGLRSTNVKDGNTCTFGADGSFGSLKETNNRIGKQEDYTIGIISPYLHYDARWIGVGAGLHIGNVYYPRVKTVKQGYRYPETGLNSTPILPRFSFRIGPEKIFFAEYNFADHFPTAIPTFTHQIVLGSGFGANNDFNIKTGFLIGSQSNESLGAYIKGYIPIENKVVIEPLIGLGSMKSVFMIGGSYRFGYRQSENNNKSNDE